MKRSEIFPSKYLKHEDLEGKDVTVTIHSADMENVGTEEKPEEKLVLRFRGRDKGLVCNVTNFDTIEMMYGDETDEWVGQPITLYTDHTVKFAGKKAPGIRVRQYDRWAPPATPTGTDDGKSAKWQLGMHFLDLAKQEKDLAGKLLYSQTGFHTMKDISEEKAAELLDELRAVPQEEAPF